MRVTRYILVAWLLIACMGSRPARYRRKAVSDDIVLWIDFNDRSARDQSLQGNHGTPANGAHYVSDGVIGGCFEFDGGNDYVNIDSVLSDVQTDTSGTWSVWVAPDDATPSTDQAIISFGDWSASTLIYMWQESTDNNLKAELYDNGEVRDWAVRTDANPFTDATWTHIVLVHDGTDAQFYINGSAVGQAYYVTADKSTWMSGISNVDRARIGALTFDGIIEFKLFSGQIDQVSIRNRALTADEIMQLYQETAP